MNIFTKPLLVSIFLFVSFVAFKGKAQIVYEPSYRTVYGYLSRLAQKGVIDLNDVVMPLPRAYINSKLDSLANHKEQLTPLEKEELNFYLKEYTLERNISNNVDFKNPLIGILSTNKNDRARFTAYQDKQFSFNLQPIIGYQIERNDNTIINQRWIGAWIYGYLGKNIGYSVDFRNSQLNNLPTGYDYKQAFSPEQGRIGDLLQNNKRFDYSLINATITAQWKWGHATFGKNSLNVGYGAGGKIILSDKVPTYPQVRLDINPVKWLSFTYAHAWLNSMVIDSNSIYSTSVPGRNQYQYREKYLAFHALTIKPIKGLSLMIGETAIYNDNLKIAYMIPIVLFSGINHYLGEAGGGTNTISNSQVFVQLSSRNHIPKTHLYGSFFIDELELSLSGSGTAASTRNARNHTAYQVGVSVSDFPINNLHLTLEYSKVQPFNYLHFIPVQTYQTSNFNLGHWIGSNADQLFTQLHYRVLRGLDVKVIYSYVRKGTVGTGAQQASSQDIYPFLWGNLNEYSYFQYSLQYEPIHDLFFKMTFKNENQSGVSTITNNTFSSSINFSF